MEESDLYDVVIIGSGMGGLACGNILAREGKRVIILEKNRQIGGNLQVFSRDRCVFDTGVHYLGGLDEGQALNRLFRYFGIMDELKLKRLDEDGFDRIHFGKEGIYYKYGMGYDNFIETLCGYFPDERVAIQAYCTAIKSVVQKLPLAQLRAHDENAIPEIDFSLNAKAFIESLTRNRQLQKVLAGNNALYAGSERTPFYVHALVLHYYIESSWRCVDGAAQITKLMSRRIRERGGVILNRAEMTGATYHDNGNVRSVLLKDGREILGEHFISNMHPQLSIDVFGKQHFRKSYAGRIQSLKNTGGMFVLDIVFHDDTFEYINYNIFQVNNDNVWDPTYTLENWPSFYMISVPPNSRSGKYARGASVICGIALEEFDYWGDSVNNVMSVADRGSDYEAYKRHKAEKVIDAISLHFPDIRSKIRSYTCSTPLTHRDYTGSPDGSGYGIEKDSANPHKTLINPRTSIPNLYLTGQNLTLHGILGVSLTAVLTCFNLVDKHELLRKINAS